MSDKRGSLSASLVAKDAVRPPSGDAAAAPATTGDAADAAGAPAKPGDAILVGKGAATAAGFRPSYWSFERRPEPPPQPRSSESSPVVLLPSSPQAAERLQRRDMVERPAAMIILGCSVLTLVIGVFLRFHPDVVERVVVVTAPPAPIIAAAPAAPTPTAEPSAEVVQLIARGNDLLVTGDIVSARLFFQRAAETGDARAALLVGETFDPAFLDLAGVRGMGGDAAQAAAWYRRAGDRGEPEAKVLLGALQR